MLLLAFALLCFQDALRAQPTPFTVVPVAGLTLPSLTGKLCFVDACRGIALQIALQMDTLGCAVTCTTRDLATYNRTQLAGSHVTLWALDYNTEPPFLGSPELVGAAYLLLHGRRPDLFVRDAERTYNGIWQSYNRTFAARAFREGFTGPYALQSVFLRNDATALPMQLGSVSSFAAWATPPFLQTPYNMMEAERLQNTRALAASQFYANTRCVVTMCVFTETQNMVQSVNPTAEAGDYAAQQFQVLFTEFIAELGIPPSVVAQGILQAMLLPGALNNDTIFDASGGLADAFGTVSLYALFSLPGYIFNEAYYEAILLGFGLDMRQRTAPTPAPSARRRSESAAATQSGGQRLFFHAIDQVMQAEKYALFLPKYMAAKAAFSMGPAGRT